MVRPGVSGVLLRRAKHFLSSDCLCGVNDSQEQAANAGAQQWDYCVPKPNYAEVRARVGSAFAEKAHELADAVAVVQGLSARILFVRESQLGSPNSRWIACAYCLCACRSQLACLHQLLASNSTLDFCCSKATC